MVKYYTADMCKSVELAATHLGFHLWPGQPVQPILLVASKV